MIEIERRKQFKFLYEDEEKFKVIVCCRGGGKTWAVGDWLMHALITGKANGSAAFFSKTLKQVKGTLEPIMARWQDIFGKKISYNGSDLTYKIKMGKNDTRVLSLFSYENEEAKRGFHPEIIVCDEVADMSESMLNKVVMPMLVPAMNEGTGRFVAIGTPKGRNLFYKLYERGKTGEFPEWKSYMLKASDSGLVNQKTQMQLANNMSNAEYAQEMECDFNANVLLGSVYGEIMTKFTEKNIDDSYGYNPTIPVYTAWDLGHSNNTSIWFFQIKNELVTFIDFFEDSGHDISYYANAVLAKPYYYRKHYLPWDAGIQNIRSSITISQMLNNFGVKNEVLSNSSVNTGIIQARIRLKTVRFNKTNCAEGLRHLKSYRFKVDMKTGVDRQKPLHDEHSDAADAFRYACIAVSICERNGGCGKMKPMLGSSGIYNTLTANF